MTRGRPDTPSSHGSRGGARGTVLLWAAIVPFLLWTVLTWTEWDEANRYVVALTALRPYAAVFGVLLCVLALMLRRWLTTGAIALVTASLLVSVLPRAVADRSGPVPGDQLRVLSVNAHFGTADPTRLVSLVREANVDVLSVQELTPELAAELDRAGLTALMPHGARHPAPGGAGAAVMSRYPVRELDLVVKTTGPQPAVRVALADGRAVEVIAVHPLYPMGRDTTGRWTRDLAALPKPSRSGTPRVLAGDFNATLDHTRMRGLLDGGYRDAAAATGRGLTPTWPDADGWLPPLATIDHVLTSGPAVATQYRTVHVPGTDHRAVLADLALGSG